MNVVPADPRVHQHEEIRWFYPYEANGPKPPDDATAAECLVCGAVLRTAPVVFWNPREAVA